MYVGKLVKFKVPTVAKFCDHRGTSDFIIDNDLYGVILGHEQDPFTNEEVLEVFAAGEVLFGINIDDLMCYKEAS